MFTAEDIYPLLSKKPVVIVRFDHDSGERFISAMRRNDKFTYAVPHDTARAVSSPAPCLIQIEPVRFASESQCFLGVLYSKSPATTLQTRLTIRAARRVKPDSLNSMTGSLPSRLVKTWQKKLKGELEILSSKLGQTVFTSIAENPDNAAALAAIAPLLNSKRKIPGAVQMSREAIKTALDIFGKIPGMSVDLELALDSDSRLSEQYYEDNVIHKDTIEVEGYDLIGLQPTGKATFQKGNDVLTIYTANKLPLENVLGVDLVYVNESRRSIVAVQYKMLEREGEDWVFRGWKQFNDELGRMQLPVLSSPPADYRMCASPWYFQFLARKSGGKLSAPIIMSKEHIEHYLRQPAARGPRNGLRLSYDSLQGSYLRRSDLIGLLRSGYIGTHEVQTGYLQILIEALSKGDTSLVLAFQSNFPPE